MAHLVRRGRGRSLRFAFFVLLATLALLGASTYAVQAQTPPPSFSIDDVTRNEGSSGGTTAFVFTVTISNYPATGNPVFRVDFATANGTATAGACISGFDYASTTGQLAFNRMNQTRTVTVQVCADTAIEPNETFFVDLSDATGGAVITKSRGVGTIVNDDVAALRPTATNVSCTPATVAVASATTCTATVTDTGSGTPTTPQGTVTFSLESDPDGDAGTFVPLACTLTGGSGASNSCSVSYAPTAAGDGVHAIGATYTPTDGSHAGSSDPTPFQLSVQARATTTSVECPASTPANVPATCTVTVRDVAAGTKSAPQGTVDFALTSQPPGSAAIVTPDPCTLAPDATTPASDDSTCTFTFTGNTVGSYTIQGSYQPAVGSIHGGSPGSDTIQVTARITSTSVDCPASTPANVPTACTVTVRDTDTAPRSPPLGTVDLTISSQPAGSVATVAPDPCTLAPDATTPATDDSTCTFTFTGNTVGSYTIQGTYQPAVGSIHGASTGSDTIQVTLRETTTTVACTPSTFQAGNTTSCTATVTDTDAAPQTPPTGFVTWSSDESTGVFVTSPCPLAPDSSTPATNDSSCTVTYTSTKASRQTITARYGGDPIHDTSFGSTIVTVEPGPPASITLDPPADTNPVDTQHCVTATVTDRFGNPTPNISVVFSVTGSNTAGGSDTTDAEGEAEFCYTGVLIGITDLITAFADFDPRNGAQDVGEPVGAATKVWQVPASTPLCGVVVTEGGFIIAQNGDRASFGGNVQVSSGGMPQGQQTYQDHGPVQPMTVKSTTILAVLCSSNGRQATIFGLATIDGAGPFAFRIDVQDVREPGVGFDTYRIRIGIYDSGERTLLGGNIQIHKR